MRFLRTTCSLVVAVTLAATIALAAPVGPGQVGWRPLEVPTQAHVSCPISHYRIIPAPVRIEGTTFSFKPGLDQLIVWKLTIENTTDCFAHRVWLFWRLYRDDDLTQPVAQSMDVPTDVRDIDKIISPSVEVNWTFSAMGAASYETVPGVTYSLELGVSLVEWADGTTWVLADDGKTAPNYAT